MPDRADDALAILEAQTPPLLYRFALAVVADPELDAKRAATGLQIAAKDVPELLRDTRTQRVMLAALGDLRETFKTQRHDAVRTLLMWATYDPAHIQRPDGTAITNLHEIHPSIRMCISGVKIKPSGEIEYKFVDKLGAMRLFFELCGDVDSSTIAPQGRAHVHFHGRAAR